MPFTDTNLRALKKSNKKYRVSAGNALYVEVYPTGGKYFVWKYRFPPGVSGKQRFYQIGPYGNGDGQWTLKKAKVEQTRLDLLRKKGEDPRVIKSEGKRLVGKQADTPSLEKVATEFLERSKAKDKTKDDYRNMIWNQVLPVLGANIPVNRFEWSNGGRQKVLDLKKGIEARGSLNQSDKVLMVIRGVFSHAIDSGWMEPPNPAISSRQSKSAHKPTKNPTLNWDQMPTFLADVEKNEANGSDVVITALKMTLMTFLRVGSLVPMRWEELDEEKDIWIVPGNRMKNAQDHIVPLTKPLKELLEKLHQVNGHEEYAFWSPRQGKLPHMNPSSINQLLIHLGYKGMLTAHGIRAIPLTVGQEVLGFSHEVIQRQMAHVVGDKVRQAYDRSEFLDERRKFMVAWCDALIEQGLVI